MFYAGAVAVTNRLGVKTDKVAGRKEPMWKRRLQNKIKELRKDLSQLEASKDKDISNFRHWERLERKYSIRVIWSQSADHKKDAKWLQDLQSEVNVKKQEEIDIGRLGR